MKKIPLATSIAIFFVFLAMTVSIRQAVLLLVGVGMGATLTGARFGFTTGWRELIETRDPRGVMGQALLLLLAAVAALPLLASFPELHPALGPPSVSLLLGAFIFGLAMQIADGCGSGTLYKAGMGMPLNMGILPLFALGSFLGSVHLDRWLALGSLEPISLTQQFGTGGALLLSTLMIGLCLLAVRVWVGPGKVWVDQRWVWGAIVLAMLGTLNLVLAGQPWGVVYGFGLWVGKGASALGLFDPSANAFWGQPGNAARLTQTLFMDVTSMTNLGILGGALLVSSGTCHAGKPLTAQQWVVGLIAGFVLGYSSRLAFGCNIGAMFSGISTGSLHGWIWVPMAFAGSLIGVRVRRYYAF